MKTHLWLLACLAFTCSSPALAQVYKCTVDGKTVYADTPCQQGAQPLPSYAVTGNAVGDLVTDSDMERHEHIVEETLKRQAHALKPPEVRSSVATYATLSDNDYRMEYQRLDQARIQAEHHPNTRSMAQCYEAAKQQLAQTHELPHETCVQQHKYRADFARQSATVTTQHITTPYITPADPISNCDANGCWGSSGQRYNGGNGGTFFRSDGKICQQSWTMIQCN